MKRRYAYFISLFLLFGLFGFNANLMAENEPAGKWKFTAPDAPYGYDKGIIEISKDGDELKATISFTGMDYRFDLEKVKYEEGRISFNLFLDGEDILVWLTFSEEDKIAGKAIYSQGEIQLFANRMKEDEQ